MSNVDFTNVVIEVIPVHQNIDVVSSPDTILSVPSSSVTIIGGTGDPSVGSSLEYPPASGLTLSNGIAVALDNGELVLASSDDPASAFGTIGIYDLATNSVIASGRITETSWAWQPYRPIFLGINGELVQTPPSNPLFLLQIGNAITPTSIAINIQQPVYY